MFGFRKTLTPDESTWWMNKEGVLVQRESVSSEEKEAYESRGFINPTSYAYYFEVKSRPCTALLMTCTIKTHAMWQPEPPPLTNTKPTTLKLWEEWFFYWWQEHFQVRKEQPSCGGNVLLGMCTLCKGQVLTRVAKRAICMVIGSILYACFKHSPKPLLLSPSCNSPHSS